LDDFNSFKESKNMFELPSMWNLIISTIVFIIAAWYIRRYLDDLGISKGMTRGLLVFVLAYLVSWGAGEAVDWFQGPQPTTQITSDPAQILKSLGRAQQ
jgi:hypothetical protein